VGDAHRTENPVAVRNMSDASDNDAEYEEPENDDLGQDAEFPDDAIDDDEVSPDEQLLLDRKELNEAGLTLDNPEGFADE
jgi:hypothetical protein